MEQATSDRRDLPRLCDPARHFEGAEPWATEWRYRFVPPNHLHCLDFYSDHGLERLLYYQFLICDVVDGPEAGPDRS